MEKTRCKWCNPDNELYVRYHDEEWGVPNFDDHYMFEMLVLESFQAGLSWETILNKREDFRKAFDNFDIDTVAGYSDEKIEELMNNEKIIRNRRKITSAVNNAQIFQKILNEYGEFYNYLKKFTDGEIIYEADQTQSELSSAISKDLKKRGMKFVGPVIIYSYLQAIGIINSHDSECFLHRQKK